MKLVFWISVAFAAIFEMFGVDLLVSASIWLMWTSLVNITMRIEDYRLRFFLGYGIYYALKQQKGFYLEKIIIVWNSFYIFMWVYPSTINIFLWGILMSVIAAFTLGMIVRLREGYNSYTHAWRNPWKWLQILNPYFVIPGIWKDDGRVEALWIKKR